MTTALSGLRRLPLVADDDAADGVVIDLRGPDAEVHLDLVALEARSRRDGGGASVPAGDVDGPAEPPGAGPVRTARLRPSRVLPVVAATIVAALAIALTGSTDVGPAPGEAEVTISGRALVTRADGTTEVVTDHADLGPGDRLDVETGTAAFELADDVALEGVAGTSVVMGLAPVLRRGQLLVDAPGAISFDAGPATVDVAAGSAARLSRTFAVTVGVYEGRAAVSSAGIDRSVPARRAAEVAAVGEVGGLRPIAYEAGDDWDRRYLGAALALDRQIGPLAAGMRASSLDPAAVLRRVRPEVADPPSARQLTRLLADRLLRLDSSIALAVVGNGEGGTFTSRWRDGLAFRDDGAPWGLVALDLGASPDAVTASLRRALDQGPVALDGAATAEDDASGAGELAGAPADPTGPGGTATGTATGAEGAEGGTGPGPGPAGSAGSGGSGGSGGASSGGGPGTPSAPTVPVTSPPATPPVTVPTVTVPPPLAPITDPVTGTVDDLTGSLGGVLSPVVGGVVGTLQPGGLLPVLPGPDQDGSGGSGGLLGGLLGG